MKNLPPICLLFICTLTIADVKKESFSIGQAFSLKVYETKDQVHLKIEDIFEHKVLKKVYEISFHGICTEQSYIPIEAKGENGAKFNLANTFISELALKESISHQLKTIKAPLTCNDYDTTLDPTRKQKANLIYKGGLDVLVSPLGKNLSLDRSDKFQTLVFE